MEPLTIYHNPRCSKSRKTLEILQTHDVPVQIVEYLKEPLSVQDLSGILAKLGQGARSIVRSKESVVTEEKLDLSSDDAAIEAIAKFPQILERPIVTSQVKAVIGRPPENVLELFDTSAYPPNSQG